jgi:hypothetical protein
MATVAKDETKKHHGSKKKEVWKIQTRTRSSICGQIRRPQAAATRGVWWAERNRELADQDGCRRLVVIGLIAGRLADLRVMEHRATIERAHQALSNTLLEARRLSLLTLDTCIEAPYALCLPT